MNNLTSAVDKGGQWSISRQLIATFRVSFLSIVLLVLVLGTLFAVTIISPRLAQAQGGTSGIITQTTIADFGGACTVLNETTVSPVNGGEIRLRATLEDYFDDGVIDNTRWLSGFVYDWFTSGPPTEAGGRLTLDGSYLRSQSSFTQSTRFFEASAQLRVNVITESSWADLGFYRQMPPFSYTETITEESAIRLFISGNDSPGLYIRLRDGGSGAPLIDEDVNDPDLTQPHNFEIRWNGATTDFYIDGGLEQTVTTTGTEPLPSWVFLYSQDPERQIQVDWVRAGQYPLEGTYTSCPLDAGGVVNWTTLSSVLNKPALTSVSFETRSSVDGTWEDDWVAVNSGNITSPSGRYLQYRVNLSTSDVTESPEVQQISVSYYGPNSIVVTPGTVTLAPGGGQQFSAQAYDANNRAVSNLNYSWQVVNGGGTINSSGLFTAGLPAGTFTNTVEASTTGVGGTVSKFATVKVNNLPPTANAGEPYLNYYEGQEVPLNGSSSSDPNNDIAGYAWDLDNDGQYDDATGITPTYPWPDDGTFPIKLRVTDSGGLTSTATSTATIANVAPTISSVTSSGPVDPGEVVTITVDAIDPGADTLSYSFDWDNDGVYEIDDQSNSQATHIFSSGGSHIVGVRVRDEDGGEATDSAVAQVGSRNVYLPFVVK